VYFEIVGRDGQRLRSFYSELIGWEIAPAWSNSSRESRREREGVSPEPCTTTARNRSRRESDGPAG